MMSVFQKHIINEWNDYFNSKVPTTLKGQLLSNLLNIESDLYVKDVFFINIQTAESGGAIYNYLKTNLLIESSLFVSCHSSVNGGAIYSMTGLCAFRNVCAYNCLADFSCNFCEINQQDNICFDYSSVSQAKSKTNNNIYFTCFENIMFRNNNISKNSCETCPALVEILLQREGSMRVPLGGLTSNHYFAVTTFQNNTQKNNCALSFEAFSEEGYISQYVEMNSCNFIGNSGPLLVSLCGSFNLLDSCVLENKVDCVFASLPDSGTPFVSLTNCSIDNKSVKNINLRENNIPISSFTYKYDNNDCIRFPSKKEVNCQTSKCYPHLVNFVIVSLSNLVIFLTN